MKRIVSVSLGSSKRDHRAEIDLEGEKYIIERIGLDGDMERARKKYEELDGQVDVICMGGTDLYFYLANRRYPVKDAFSLVRNVEKTPIADGSKLKVTLEYLTVKRLAAERVIEPEMKCLMISAVDRYGMAKAFSESCSEVLYGDFLFALGLPIPLHRLGTVRLLARILLPIIGRLPFKMLYPTGKKQEENRPKYPKCFAWADIIAGDFNFIARYMPPRLDKKIVLTNTVTQKDIELLRERGVRALITTTPSISGRSFGTNVIEGILVSILKKPAEQITAEEAKALLERLKFEPRVDFLH